MTMQEYLSVEMCIADIETGEIYRDSMRGLFNSSRLDIRLHRSEIELFWIQVILSEGAMQVGNYVIGFGYESVYRRLNNL